MGTGSRTGVRLAAFLALALAAAGSCTIALPGQMIVTVASDVSLNGTLGDLHVEIHEGSATGDLRGEWIEPGHELLDTDPFTVTMRYISPGDHVAVAWLDHDNNFSINTGDVVSSCACPPPVTVPPDGSAAATVTLDMTAP